MEFRHFIGPEGPTDAKIAVVCEKPARDEVHYNRLLIGQSGQRVREHLKLAGLDAGSVRSYSKDVWLTNAVQNFNDPGANPSEEDISREIPRLYRELCNLHELRAIISMGTCALQALSNFKYSDITNRRGSRLLTPFGVKYIPTFHPAYYMRGEWRYQPVVQFDINRAVEESKCRELIKKPRNWYIRPSLTEALEWFTHLTNSTSRYLSFDIETVQNQTGSWYITCLAFSVDPTEAFCIPLMNRDRSPYWSELSIESLIWRKVAELLSIPTKIYITQNGTFDCWQLRKHGIKTPYMSNGFDTFSAHSLLAPDLPHKLGFIVSIYTDEEYYKDESGRGQGGYGEVDENQFWIYNAKDAALTLESAIAMMEDMREL